MGLDYRSGADINFYCGTSGFSDNSFRLMHTVTPGGKFTVTSCPIPLVLTALLPLGIGLLTRFRFPLWSYFVWTALVAAELGYYLR
jgi:hypothetical protein